MSAEVRASGAFLLLDAIDKVEFVQTRDADELVIATLLALVERGEIAETEQRYGYTIFEITNKGRATLDETDTQELRQRIGHWEVKRPSSGDVALWLWLLRAGGVVSGIFGTAEKRRPEFLHLLCCGLDYDRSGSPEDGTWIEGGSTFDEPDTYSGITGWAVCRCGYTAKHTDWRPYSRQGIQVVAEISGYVELLKEMMA